MSFSPKIPSRVLTLCKGVPPIKDPPESSRGLSPRSSIDPPLRPRGSLARSVEPSCTRALAEETPLQGDQLAAKLQERKNEEEQVRPWMEIYGMPLERSATEVYLNEVQMEAGRRPQRPRRRTVKFKTSVVRIEPSSPDVAWSEQPSLELRDRRRHRTLSGTFTSIVRKFSSRAEEPNNDGPQKGLLQGDPHS